MQKPPLQEASEQVEAVINGTAPAPIIQVRVADDYSSSSSAKSSAYSSSSMSSSNASATRSYSSSSSMFPRDGSPSASSKY
jgi:hypothetical protein